MWRDDGADNHLGIHVFSRITLLAWACYGVAAADLAAAFLALALGHNVAAFVLCVIGCAFFAFLGTRLLDRRDLRLVFPEEWRNSSREDRLRAFDTIVEADAAERKGH